MKRALEQGQRSVTSTTGSRVHRRSLHTQLPTLLLASSMFFTGAAGLVSEYILSTVSSYLLGNSIEQFSVIIALMLLMMGIAGYVQRYLSDRNLIDKFIIVEVSIALLVGFAPIAIYAAFGFMEYHFRLVQYFFVTTIGFLIGFEIPLVLRINQTYARDLGTNLASTYAFDYLGSFVGALVWTYALLRFFPITEISFLVAGVNFAVAVLAFAYFLSRGLVAHRIPMLIAVAATIGALGYGYTHNRDWSQILEQRLYRDRIVLAQTTKYQQLVMTYNRTREDYRFYINGNLQFSSTDEYIYHEQLVHPVMALVPEHRSVLVLGGGDGLALRELLKYPTVEYITLVDLDPEMIEVASTNPVLTALNDHAFADAQVQAWPSSAVTATGDRRVLSQTTGQLDLAGNGPTESIGHVEVFTVDADRFIADVAGTWDVILIDLPDPNSIELAKLYSKEFYLKLQRVLAPRGMVALQATSPYHAKESYLCIQRTIEAAGFTTVPYHDYVASFGDWGWILAWKQAMPEVVIRSKIADLESFPVATRYLTPEVFRKSLVFGKGWLQSLHTDISTLMYPRVLHYYLRASWNVGNRAL